MSSSIYQLIEIIQFNRQTDSYILVLTDKSMCVEMNKATANTLTIPANADVAFPVGTWVMISQYGAGQTTIAPDTGVTMRSANSSNKTAAQYAIAMLIKVGTNEWYLCGNIIN